MNKNLIDRNYKYDFYILGVILNDWIFLYSWFFFINYLFGFLGFLFFKLICLEDYIIFLYG